MSRLGIIGIVIVVVFVAVALFAPWIATHDVGATNLSIRYIGPSAGYWFGTDSTGRDIFSRVVFGARISLEVGIVVVTVLGLQLGVLLAGAIITEKIFGWPGLGLLLVEDGIGKRDYRVVQGCVLAISTTYILANTLTDMVYRWLDPRIRVS